MLLGSPAAIFIRSANVGSLFVVCVGRQDSAAAERFHHAMAQRREQINSLCLEGRGFLIRRMNSW